MIFKLRKSRLITIISAIITASIVVACGPQGGGGSPTGQVISISGAGATFPAPLYQNWFKTYAQQVDPNVQISYQSVGSGAGLEQYINGTVDFGASDAPISGDRLKSFQERYNANPIQVPMAGGAVVFAYNLPGVDELKLPREVYCGIVTGKITRWNDPKLVAANPGKSLPDKPITFAHRSDGSGTTFIFVNHINTVCPDWPAGVGTSVNWPVGVGGQGNEGVAAQIQQNEGTIGYVEYAYAKLNNLPRALVENKSGNFIYPSPEAASKTFAGTTIPEDFALLVPDPENPEAFPIAGLTWILVYPEYEDAKKWEALKGVLLWALGDDGKKIAEQLDYVPMPPDIVDRVKVTLDKVKVKS
ncbi:MAG: phosphate ABC transporter substrate-binding protein PstS [Thermosynechococcus sp. Uc]|uniref:phosphate ABC transporter substrate-binding protein PstS n=1 Tax=Thermosynechococcus sp. Uc TaxID=3034853 RepID=UPI001A00CA2E|nr:phosphate ABC transporter substrate-binding protein PstS [Thermosynechococcus sp. Uc]MDM7325691.1 phosphate ABC transporter substrate-binding protein PstS [Thermosynechococcus sp. Uc]HIK24531.1 phosphate ABC transporter substrate-binding protein PstS [Thermosynechococcus sp. M46_R2017_013]